MKYTDEYFENQVEQGEIKQIVLEALGNHSDKKFYYHNLIIAFSDMLRDFIYQSLKDEVFTKSVKNKDSQLRY